MKSGGFVFFLLFSAASAFAQPVATLQITRSPHGPTVPSDFVGLSIEQNIGLTTFGPPTAPNGVFFNLMKNLGVSTLRMGGDSEDQDCWAGEAAPNPAICQYSLTSADFQSWFHASQVTGWPIILGLNMAQAESPGATQYTVGELNTTVIPIVANHAPASILAFEAGNELNLYSVNGIRPPTYSLANQTSDLLSYMSALKDNSTTAPYPIAAPSYYDLSINSLTTQVEPLLSSVTGCTGCTGNVGLVTLHEYPLSIKNGNIPTIAQLLSPTTIGGIVQPFSQAVTDMQTKFGLQVQIDETGSVAPDPGQPGVSDVQAAALWALDYELAMAQIGIRRMNFHIHRGSYYVPIQVTDNGGSFTNTVMPTYYGMYAFSPARGQQFLPVTLSTSSNIRAYALSTCATCAITVFLINKDLTASGTVQISLSAPANNAGYLELTAPSLSSSAPAITFGGVQFNNNSGKLTGSLQYTGIQPSSGVYTVTLHNASAGILSIQP